MTNLDQFVAACANAAQRLGIKHVIIAARDPVSNETSVVASPDAMQNLGPVLSAKIAEKIGAEDEAMTGWPGVG